MNDAGGLTDQQIAAESEPLGWRLVLRALHTEVRVSSLTEAARAASIAGAAVGDGQAHLSVDVRPDRAVLRLVSPDVGEATGRDLRLAREVSTALEADGMSTTPGLGDPALQATEIAIDALDIRGIRPFWQALTGYADEPGSPDPDAALVDPTGRGPAIWFQQMDAERPQRNRIHLDIWVPPEVAATRIDAAIAVGGRLLSDMAAPAFWVLADPEGNEACICTWQGRD